MDAFTESELRLKFIQARNTWFEDLLASIPTDNGEKFKVANNGMSNLFKYFFFS